MTPPPRPDAPACPREGEHRRGRVRLLLAGAVAAGVVATGVLVPAASGGAPSSARTGSLSGLFEVAKGRAGVPHTDPAGTPPHRHDDPATKNLVSRSSERSSTTDPTTPSERAASAAYVARERRLPDPPLTTVAVRPQPPLHPTTRYAMAGGCYTLGAGERAVRVSGDALRLARPTRATPFFFRATDLGRFLLYTPERRFVAVDGTVVAEPGDRTDLVTRHPGRRFTFSRDGARLTVGGASAFRLLRTRGCTAYPESQIDVSGRPHAGVTPYQEVRGYVDAHTHGMAFEFLGGDAHCGKPWDRFGAPYALVDCPDHTATGGYGAALETLLSGKPGHDPVGWPTFKDWPAPDSLTHEGTYYRWLERSWRGGQRLFVNLLVENNQLCTLYPIKHNSCDDMDSVRLQAQDMYRLQDYVDAQFGGPGKGFYRIVTDPFEARRVINSGKMAVVMGIETSVPFGCTFKNLPGGDVPACDPADIDRQLDEVHRLGVRQMELVNKFDNALSGVAGDNGAVGVAVNSANFNETASFWDMRHCDPADGESHDRDQTALPDISAGQQDALFGAVEELFGTANLPALPLYPPPHHCNARGLTTLGEHTIAGLAKRHMIFDPDHMSVEARASALDQVEQMGYHGVVSSHSWSTPDAYPRIYREGGFITPYAGDSTGFVAKWRQHVQWADPRYYFGMGYGADINGLGAQGNPRGADVANPVTYPFTGLGGVRIGQQHAGQRVYDLNVDGVAQYGLYPDWIEDLAKVAGATSAADADAITEDMTRGSEAYLQMWERAVGIAPDACRNPDLAQREGAVRRLVAVGDTTREVMQALGQPYQRLGHRFETCARDASGDTVTARVRFDDLGRVTSLGFTQAS